MTAAGASGGADWTIASVTQALTAKQISARELTREFYGHIARRNPELNAYLALCPERAYAAGARIFILRTSHLLTATGPASPRSLS